MSQASTTEGVYQILNFNNDESTIPQILTTEMGDPQLPVSLKRKTARL